jgi:hypothetical protein
VSEGLFCACYKICCGMSRQSASFVIGIRSVAVLGFRVAFLFLWYKM